MRGNGVSLFFLPSDAAIRQFGSLVPRRLFGTAVGRNYARRRLREYFRRNKELFPVNCQILVRLYAAPKDWNDFFVELDRLLKVARKKAASRFGAPGANEERAR